MTSLSTAEKLMQCPVCLELMSGQIRQCQNGHSVCADCVTANKITICPLCRVPMATARNFQLEQLIATLKISSKFPCSFQAKGCKYELKCSEKENHERECRYRTFRCEGKIYAKWNCNWTGNYDDVLQHFKSSHAAQSSMEFKTDARMKINLQANFVDLQIVNYHNGQQLFWYKHKVDVDKQKAYWTFQCLGSGKQANCFYYEFEVHQGPTRKFKVIEVCESDAKSCEEIFDADRCVCMSFNAIRSYLDQNGELAFRFRLMKIKKV